MDRVERKLGEVRSRIGVEWDEGKVAHAFIALQRRAARRRNAARVAGATAVTALASVATVLLLRVSAPTTSPPTPTASAPPQSVAASEGGGKGSAEGRSLHLRDGSKLRLLDADTVLSVLEDVPERTTMALERGVAHFEVQPRPSRTFLVKVGDISVSALGTAFTVDRKDSAVGVWVTHGRVRVDWSDGMRVLSVGQHEWFPPASSPPADIVGASAIGEPGSAARARAPHLAARGRSGSPVAGSNADWRSLADQKRYVEAYALLRSLPRARLDDPESLLMAADVARLSGDPAGAVPYFERLLQRHPGDSRAPGAAFSMGRILLNSLGRPGDAALAFARARRLSPEGPLAEDALAREVEAWSRAGLPDKASMAAREYLERYPRGSRVTAVRRYGGQE